MGRMVRGGVGRVGWRWDGEGGKQTCSIHTMQTWYHILLTNASMGKHMFTPHCKQAYEGIWTGKRKVQEIMERQKAPSPFPSARPSPSLLGGVGEAGCHLPSLPSPTHKHATRSINCVCSTSDSSACGWFCFCS